jgi:RNA-binding protein
MLRTSASSRSKPKPARGPVRGSRFSAAGAKPIAPVRRKPKPKPENEREDRAPAAAPALTKRQQQDYRAQAHHLEPLVHIGHQGLHAAAFAAVGRALREHELIKVRLHEPENKREMAKTLADNTGSALCGLVGHTVILYKPKPKLKRPGTR